MRACNDFTVVKVEYESKEGRFVLPDQSVKQEAAFHGIVLAVGPRVPYDVKPGDKIFFHRSEGRPISTGIGQEELYALKPRAILAKEVTP